MKLVYKNENPLKIIAIVISLLVWVAVLVVTKGLFLIYIAFFGLMYLFAQSGFISHIKGTGVKVSSDQYPDIFAQLEKSCQAVELTPVPDCYVLRMNTFNALATRFLGRNFVVLFAEVVDTLRDHPDALAFYLGHELGHLKRKHLQWHPFLMPASFLPLLGAAYHRAREYTCDRHGLACSPNLESAQRGLIAIATGRSRLQATNVLAFAGQTAASGSFWMSFHEIIGDYPWLTKRVAEVTAVGEGKVPAHPSRSPFAWVLAAIVPRLGVMGGGTGPLVTIAMIGILAAIAIPAYQDYTIRARVAEGLNLAGQYEAAVANAFAAHSNRLEGLNNAAVGLPETVTNPYVATIKVINGAIVITYGSRAPVGLAGKSLVLIPGVTNTQDVVWVCGQASTPAGVHVAVPDYEKYTSVPPKWLPIQCRAR
ncbi:MAG TPA: pilin [Steroidobacteraceae bacterium]|jgi:Tfp pilus assembly major pilin PilA/Zn-dependent protease with chaperone function|nr:pilin [Steroidobacteraceae bacterium]